jgi:FtsH-binding integral membrane protein
MTDHDSTLRQPRLAAATFDASIDAGLRAFMLGVYNKLALGLVVSAVLAWATSSAPAVRDLLFLTLDGRLAGYTPLGWVVAVAPLAILLGAGFLANRVTPRSAGALYWVIVSLIGASLGAVALRYTGQSIASTFLITAAAFGSLSLFGYATRRDLSGLGAFLIMGVVGLVLASLVNLFLQSSLLMFAISAVGVLVFAGLTAHDTQRLKLSYYELGADQAARGVATSYGALNLYLDFINLFQFLLMFLGQRR